LDKRSASPLAEGFYALLLSIVWYRELSPDEALRAMRGETRLKPGRRSVTPELAVQLDKILRSKNFRNFDRIERLFRVDRYRIIEAVADYRKKAGMPMAGREDLSVLIALLHRAEEEAMMCRARDDIEGLKTVARLLAEARRRLAAVDSRWDRSRPPPEKRSELARSGGGQC